MELITESKLRELFKEGKLKNIKISSDSLITPSARQYIRDKNIELINEEKKSDTRKTQVEKHIAKEDDQDEISRGRAKVDKSDNNFMYSSYYTGAYFKEKPEAMTQLFGKELVYKDHPIIEFRGKIDSMQSKILEVMIKVEKKKINDLYEDLNETLNVLRNILSSEVRGNNFELNKILGLTAAEVREHSHNPQKHYGIKHIIPDTKMGEILVELNSLRSLVREVEIAAVKAFHWERDVERTDIIRALNRMSSVYYVMMCKYQSGKYGEG